MGEESLFFHIYQICSLLSDWDTHQGARKNSGSVEPAKKAPISSRNLSSTLEDDHYDIPYAHTHQALLNVSHTRSSVGGDGAKVVDWNLAMI